MPFPSSRIRSWRCRGSYRISTSIRAACMLECVAYRLGCNAVDVISNNRSEVSRCALHLHLKLGRVRVALICEFRSERADRLSEVIRNNRRATQSLHCISALGDCLPGLLDGSLQYLLGLVWAIPNHVHPGVKLHQHRLKALQQSVVQFQKEDMNGQIPKQLCSRPAEIRRPNFNVSLLRQPIRWQTGRAQDRTRSSVVNWPGGFGRCRPLQKPTISRSRTCNL